MKTPPTLIIIVGFVAALDGFGMLFWGIRALGFDWFGWFGDLPALESIGAWAWLSIGLGIIWVLAAIGLWTVQPWARTFAIVIAGLSLFEAVLAFFQFPGTGTGFAMSIMPLIMLWYLNSADVKDAFTEDSADDFAG